jgi:hypothetical protein
MKAKAIFILIFILSVFYHSGSAAPAETAGTQVSISVSENLAFIGDRIRLKIIVKTTSDVDNINVKTMTQDFEILEQTAAQKRQEQDSLIFEKVAEIAFFKTGDFNVGPFVIELKKNEKVMETRETNSVPVTIKTTLKEEDKDIKPLKNLLEIKGNPWYLLKYVLGVLAVILITLLILFFLKRRKAKAEAAPKRLLSPLEELEVRIKELYQQSLFEKGKMKFFFIELTVILKQFLHRNYQFNAEDFTTYETLYDLKKRESEVSLINNLEYLFSISDLVKFAKYIPEEDALNELAKKIEDTIGIYKVRAATALEQMQKEKVS